MEFKHTPVLLKEVLENLNIRPDGIYVDGTLGGAGHAEEIVKRLGEGGRLIGIDQDADAIRAAKDRLASYKEKVSIFRSNYESFADVLSQAGVERVDGFLLDLGVSSYQLDTAERGFSYSVNAPLDMRMDDRQSRTAADIVNTYSRKELTRILREYGEERFAPQIAAGIEKARQKAPLTTTFELDDVIRDSIPARFREHGGHPAKRTFQAIRIELNRELEVLQDSIGAMIDSLNEGGRICIITFHSLEDRIVKNAFKKAQDPCTCPPDFPVCVCGQISKGHIITRKPILPGEEEQEINPRSRSAKLRVFERKTGTTGKWQKE